MGAREKLAGWFGDSVTDATVNRVIDEALALHRQEMADEINRHIAATRAADWGKSRGKLVYIQGLGQARRIIEKWEQ